MRATLLAAVLSAALSMSAAAAANAPPSDLKGLWLTTDYPRVTLRAGEESRLSIGIINYNLAPQRADLSLDGVPEGWTAELRGGGRPISGAIVEHNVKSNLDLKLKVPVGTKPGDYTLTVKARAPDWPLDLPIVVTVASQLPPKLTAEPKLPVLRGSPSSNFDFRVTVKNESADDILATLAAKAPRGFLVSFKEGYGPQELTSLPIKTGDSKELSVDIKLPRGVPAGKYPITVEIASEKARAQTQLTLDITGQPTVALTGQNERLSGEAYTGQEKRFTFQLRNTGSAEARNITLSASSPTGWQVKFEPKEIAALSPNSEQKFDAIVVPSEKAVAGDYVFNVNANGDGVSESAAFRVTVLTSTIWGAVGLGVIAVSLLVLVGAVGRFGRR
jgi:uncharacterized membrane protein